MPSGDSGSRTPSSASSPQSSEGSNAEVSQEDASDNEAGITESRNAAQSVEVADTLVSGGSGGSAESPSEMEASGSGSVTGTTANRGSRTLGSGQDLAGSPVAASSTGTAGAGLGDWLEESEEETAHADTSVSVSQPTDNAPRGGAATESEQARGESPSVSPSASVNQCSAEVVPLDSAVVESTSVTFPLVRDSSPEEAPAHGSNDISAVNTEASERAPGELPTASDVGAAERDPSSSGVSKVLASLSRLSRSTTSVGREALSAKPPEDVEDTHDSEPPGESRPTATMSRLGRSTTSIGREAMSAKPPEDVEDTHDLEPPGESRPTATMSRLGRSTTSIGREAMSAKPPEDVEDTHDLEPPGESRPTATMSRLGRSTTSIGREAMSAKPPEDLEDVYAVEPTGDTCEGREALAAELQDTGISANPEERLAREHDGENEEEEAELARCSTCTHRRGARTAVAAECWQSANNWKPPVHKKSPAQRSLIMSAVAHLFMFQNLSQEDLESIVKACKGPLKIKKKAEVCRQGAVVGAQEPGLYIIEKGVLDVFHAEHGVKHPGNKVAAYDRPGQCFGELALLHSCPRPATVVAVADSLVWSLDREAFNRLVKGAQLARREAQARLLQNLAYFGGLSAEDVQRVVDSLQVRNCEKGELIASMREDVGHLFILEQGKAFASSEGRRLQEYAVGELIRADSLSQPQLKEFDVIADASPTRLMVLDAESLRQLVGTPEELSTKAATKTVVGVAGAETAATRAAEAEAEASAQREREREAVAQGAGVGSLEVGDEADEVPMKITQAGQVASWFSSEGAFSVADGCDSEIDEYENDEQEAEEMARLQAIALRRGRRVGVSMEVRAATFANWRPPPRSRPGVYRDCLEGALRSSWLLKALPVASLELLKDAFNGPTRLKANMHVFRQGQRVSGSEPCLFVLEKGALAAFRASEREELPGSKIATFEQPGQCVGELALLYDSPREESVVAIADAHVWSLSRDTFDACTRGVRISERTRRLQFLEQVKPIQRLSVSDRHGLLDVVQTHVFSQGNVILRSGDPVKHFLVVEEGSVAVEGSNAQRSIYGPGTYFGEGAFRNTGQSDRHQHSVIAESALTQAFALSIEQIVSLCRPLDGRVTPHNIGFTPGTLVHAQGTRKSDLHRGVVPPVDWLCPVRGCAFQNFPRSEHCLKCGAARPLQLRDERQPGPQLLALPADPSWPRPSSPASAAAGSKLSAAAAASAAAVVAFAGVQVAQSTACAQRLLVRYAQRAPAVGVLQGRTPLAPGERFEVEVQSTGTFGEIGLGLAPQNKAAGTATSAVVSGASNTMPRRNSLTPAPAPVVAQQPMLAIPAANPNSGAVDGAFGLWVTGGVCPSGQNMIGWALGEVGLHGDHGRWYQRGRASGPQVSLPWSAGDTVVCGLNLQGHPYFAVNGQQVAETDTSWRLEHSYPTLTLRSAGAELIVGLAGVVEKPSRERSGPGVEGRAGARAAELLETLRRTVVGVPPSHKGQVAPSHLGPSRWPMLWCGCGELRAAAREYA